MISVSILRNMIFISKFVIVHVPFRWSKRFSCDLLVIRDNRFAAVQIAVRIGPGHSFHSHRLSADRHISVPLHSVSVRLLPRFVLQRLQWVAPVDALHGRLPSLVEHLPHLCMDTRTGVFAINRDYFASNKIVLDAASLKCL